MPARLSAGVLLYRRRAGVVEVLLVHPGGPFWRRKDDGAWSLPKGEFGEDELAETAARREFREETGHDAPASLVALAPVRQAGGKIVHPFAGEVEPRDRCHEDPRRPAADPGDAGRAPGRALTAGRARTGHVIERRARRAAAASPA